MKPEEVFIVIVMLIPLSFIVFVGWLMFRPVRCNRCKKLMWMNPGNALCKTCTHISHMEQMG